MKSAIVLLDIHAHAGKQVKFLISALKEAGIDKVDTEIIVFGSNIKIDNYIKLSCKRIIIYDSEYCLMENYKAEPLLDAIIHLHEIRKYDVLLFADGVFENELATRAGFRLGGSTVVNIEKITAMQEKFIVKKSIYSYNLKADLQLKHKPYVLSIANGMYPPDESSEAITPEMVYMRLEPAETNWVCGVEIEPDTEEDIFDNARVIIVGGRGVAGKNGMAKLQNLAVALGGILGGTRPTVLDGWIESNRLIGVSGKIISPDLCLTFGVSGCMPLVAGIQQSKMIISVNSDESASIFKSSDVGIHHDYSEIVDSLLIKLANNKRN